MNELTESLLKAIDEIEAIKNGELKLKKRDNWPFDSYYVPDDEEIQDVEFLKNNSNE